MVAAYEGDKNKGEETRKNKGEGGTNYWREVEEIEVVLKVEEVGLKEVVVKVGI